SRRRHTRFSRDWSSDVCSSDLEFRILGMGLEIERKFLVTSDAWRAAATGSALLRQGYLSSNAKATVRVRSKDDARAVLTLKGARSEERRVGKACRSRGATAR